MNDPKGELANAIHSFGPGPLFVHSDLLGARDFVGRLSSRDELLASHHQVLTDVAAGRCIWTPCFNYDFTKTAFVDLRSAPCQVGPFGEFRRLQPDVWRTTDPVFSVCGTGPVAIELIPPGSLIAFGEQSIFAELYRRDGTLLFYGAPFSSATVLHYAECLAGGPIYRYDKVFSGTIVDCSGAETQVEYVYHVRPWERQLDYEWSRLLSDLRSGGILSEMMNGNQVVATVTSVRALVDFWVSALEADPFYLLDVPSREWVAPLFERLHRRFEVSDFE